MNPTGLPVGVVSNNDYIQIYVEQDGDDIILSDDGHTLHTLCANGCEITPNRDNSHGQFCISSAFRWKTMH